MNWKVICYCLLSFAVLPNLVAQVYNRGVISSQKKPVPQKKVTNKPSKVKEKSSKKPSPIPKSSTKAPKISPKPDPKPIVKKEKKLPEKTFSPKKVLIFPKLLFPQIRADFAGFQTNIKGFVPITVVFKLRKTSKLGVKITEYKSPINKVVSSSSNTSKLEIITPKTMPPGYYDIYVLSASNKRVLVASNIMVLGIVSAEQSFFALVQNGVVNAYPMLTIRGYGFGAMSKANYVYLNKMRLSTAISWSDTMIKLTIPYWVNTGASYVVKIRNSKGVEIPQKNVDSTLVTTFTYKGINANFFNAELNPDDLKRFKNMDGITSLISSEQNKSDNPDSKDNTPPIKVKFKKKSKGTDKGLGGQYLTILQIKGIGFGKVRGDSKVYLNSTEARQIVSWSDTLITIKATAFRPGKYVSKIFLHPNDRRRKVVYSSRDSFYVWGRIPYKLSRIIGASYTISLKKSELPTELVQKKISYIYTLPQDARAELALYDADGKNLYAKFFSDEKVQSKGRYKLTYSATDLSSGKYLLVFTVNRDKFMKVFHPVVVR